MCYGTLKRIGTQKCVNSAKTHRVYIIFHHYHIIINVYSLYLAIDISQWMIKESFIDNLDMNS